MKERVRRNNSITIGTKVALFMYAMAILTALLTFLIDWKTMNHLIKWAAWAYTCIFTPIACIVMGMTLWGRKE